MICPSCQQQTADGTQFCKHCGGALQQVDAAISMQTAEEPIPVPVPNIQDQPNKDNPVQVQQPKPLSLLDALGMVIIFFIPVVNLIMMLVWSFGTNVNPSKKSIARAILIVSLLTMIISLLLGVDIFSTSSSL